MTNARRLTRGRWWHERCVVPLSSDDSNGFLVSNAPTRPASTRAPSPSSGSSQKGKDFVKAACTLLAAALFALPLPARAQTPRTTATSPFLGGVPSGAPTSEPVRLTVIAAILRALDHNLGVLEAEDAIGRAQGARWNALSALLPNVRGQLDERRQ